MTGAQHKALMHPCLLACETIHPRFKTIFRTHSVIVTVNAGYE